jgi:hypothetical protein
MYLFLMAYLLESWAESQGVWFYDQGRAQLVWWEYPRRRCSPVYICSRNNNVNLILQRLLLVHTPPRPEVQLGQEVAESNGRGREGFYGSLGMRRAITWLTDGSPTPRPRTRLRSVERRWMTDGSQNGQHAIGLD